MTSSAFLSSPFRFGLAVGLLVLATVGAVAMGNGNPVFALLPTLAAAVVWAACVAPLRYSVLALLTLLLVVDYVPENPFHGYWTSPLGPLGRALLSNLNQLTGVGFLRAPLVVLAMLFLMGVGIYRRATHKSVDADVVQTASCQAQALVVSLVAILGLWVWGALRGGNAREGLWQIQQLLALPLVAFLFHAALRGPRDFRTVGWIIVAAAGWKALTAIYFIYRVVRPQGLHIEWATSHSDTFLFVTALVLLIVRWTEEPTSRVFVRCAPLFLLIFWGMVLNDRRLAYVALAISLLFVTGMMPRHRLRTTFQRLIVLGLPVALVYVVIGWNAGSSLFAPVHVLRSLIVGEGGPPGQPDYRDLENANVIATWMKNGVLGSGFGHPFDTPFALPDISFVMPMWKYHPHNSLLWLWSNGGLIGYSLATLHLGVTAMLAGRAYTRATRPVDRAAALGAISVLVCYLVQCFGDMGTTSWLGAFFVALATAVTGKLAVDVGAWPARQRA